GLRLAWRRSRRGDGALSRSRLVGDERRNGVRSGACVRFAVRHAHHLDDLARVERRRYAPAPYSPLYADTARRVVRRGWAGRRTGVRGILAASGGTALEPDAAHGAQRHGAQPSDSRAPALITSR